MRPDRRVKCNKCGHKFNTKRYDPTCSKCYHKGVSTVSEVKFDKKLRRVVAV